MAENIQNFGGDPKKVTQTEHFFGGDTLISLKVTIFGESAGGACVAYHLLRSGLLVVSRKMKKQT